MTLLSDLSFVDTLSPDIEMALGMVGAEPREISELLAAYDGEAYLCGSLAAGLGDRLSDIDIHVVSDDPRASEGSALAFTSAGTCVDIRYLGRHTVEHVLAASRPGQQLRPSGRSGSWLMSRWLNAVPLRADAPPLLNEEQQGRARCLIKLSLAGDLIALTAFAELAEIASVPRAWYLCRRAGTVAWELAATLAGQHYLGERWLPGRSGDSRVTAIAEVACRAESTAEIHGLLRRLSIAAAEVPLRVRICASPAAERWNIAGEGLVLVGGRRLVRRLHPVPVNAAAAAEQDPATVLDGLAAGALQWTVDLAGVLPRLAAER
jgi:Nucleotidyltransferase domain